MKKKASMPAIQPSVVAAFRELGDRNALTPLEMASVPVIATHPSAKARRIRNVSANPVGHDMPCCVADSASTFGIPTVGASSWPMKPRATPAPINATIRTMKMYVGTLNAMPDSRTPRRFTSISSTMAAMQMPMVCGPSQP